MNAQVIVNDFKSEVFHFAGFKLPELREAASLLNIKGHGNLRKTELLSKIFNEILNTSIKEGILSMHHQKHKTIKLMNKPSIPRDGSKSQEILKYLKANPSLTKQEIARDMKVNSALVRHVMVHYMNPDK